MRLIRSRASRTGVDNSAVDFIHCGTGSSLADIDAGTVLAWVRPSTVANAVRNIASKSVIGGGWEFFKRGTNGTTVRFAINRTSGLSIDSAASTLVANVWQLMVATWDINDSTKCKLYRSTGAQFADVTGTVTMGSGTPSTDIAMPLRLMANSTPAAGWPGALAAFALIRRVISLSEITHSVTVPWSTLGCAGLWYPGHDGASGLVIDRSGNGNHGTVTGTTMSDAPPIGVRGAVGAMRSLVP